MSTEDQRYPLSTPEGTAIPLEILRPSGLVLKTFTETEGSALVTVPEDINLLLLFSEEDCLICFGDIAALPTDNVQLADAFYLVGQTFAYINPPAQSLSVMGIATSGTLKVQFLKTWAGLALATQLSRRF